MQNHIFFIKTALFVILSKSRFNNKEKRMERKDFIKGALWITVGGFVSKVIGALYRIPLTNLIGGYGIGLYQMIYPFYCLLLTLSATGIPSAVSALTASEFAKGNLARNTLSPAMKLFAIIGGIGTILMLLLSGTLAKAQGETALIGGYIALAPSVFLVSIIAVFRGWLQGRGNMKPTAISEILEQLIKVCVGLLFAYLYRGNIQKSVTALLFAVTVSELCALCYMFVCYKRVHAPILFKNQGDRVAVKEILKVSIFVTLTSALLPLSNMIESVLLPRLLNKYTTEAVSLYGLYAGGAVTLVGLPVSLCYGIVAVTVPSVASSPQNERRKRIFYALGLTLLISVPCAVGLYLFAPTAVNIIYRALSVTEKQTLIHLLRALSPTAVTLSALQTLSACLTAQGKSRFGSVSMFFGVVVKLILDVVLIANPNYSILGATVSANTCYALVFLINLFINLRVSKKEKQQTV